MLFNTKYNYVKHSKPEVNSGKTLVEKAGYLSAQKRIENMILAGQRLVDYRKAQYDFPEGEIKEDFEDPTRAKNFDLAEATQLQLRTEASLKARQKQQEALREASKAEIGVKDIPEDKSPE